MRRENGITVINLAITIIILLILAGVTIATISGDNGILTQAGKAKENTEIANEEEILEQAIILAMGKNRYGELSQEELENQINSINNKSKSKVYASGGDFLVEFESKRVYTVNQDGEITNMERELKIATIDTLDVGDYIKYGDKLDSKTYETDILQTGHESSQIFETNTDVLWRVINKKENGEVEIVAVENILSDDNTIGLYLNSKTGFLNAEIVLNNLCEKLFTNSKYGTARSIKIEDINNLADYTPGEPTKTAEYTAGGPFWDEESNTFIKPSASNPLAQISNYYKYIPSETMPLYDTLIEEVNTEDTETGKTNSNKFYWLASRCVDANPGNGARFFVRFTGMYRVDHPASSPTPYLYQTYLGYNYIRERERSFGIRPIVTLKSDVIIDKRDITKDGSSPENAMVLL